MYKTIIIVLLCVYPVMWIISGSLILFCKIYAMINPQARRQNREYEALTAETCRQMFGDPLDEAGVRAITEAMQRYAGSEATNPDAQRFAHNELMLAAIQDNDVKKIANEVFKCRYRVGEKPWAEFIKYRSNDIESSK